MYGVDLGKGMSYTGIDRQPVTYNQISPYMLAAIVAIEDDRYWSTARSTSRAPCGRW